MESGSIGTSSIKEKSVKEGIPFSNLLGGYILEECAGRISISGWFDYLWLRNGSSLGIEAYRKNLTLILEYDYMEQQKKVREGQVIDPRYPGAQLSKGLMEWMLEELFLHKGSEFLSFTGEVKEQPYGLEIILKASLEEMKVPVKIKIFPLKQNRLMPRKKTQLLCVREEEIDYFEYPPELLLAEKFLIILKKMELIQDMEAYGSIYEVLKSESIDGRKVKESISELCMVERIVPREKRFLAIKSYRNYAYMKKKWRAYLRSKNKNEPAWEKVMDLFVKFYEPIYKALEEDTIFFADWMPDLERYLI